MKVEINEWNSFNSDNGMMQMQKKEKPEEFYDCVSLISTSSLSSLPTINEFPTSLTIDKSLDFENLKLSDYENDTNRKLKKKIKRSFPAVEMKKDDEEDDNDIVNINDRIKKSYPEVEILNSNNNDDDNYYDYKQISNKLRQQHKQKFMEKHKERNYEYKYYKTLLKKVERMKKNEEKLIKDTEVKNKNSMNILNDTSAWYVDLASLDTNDSTTASGSNITIIEDDVSVITTNTDYTFKDEESDHMDCNNYNVMRRRREQRDKSLCRVNEDDDEINSINDNNRDLLQDIFINTTTTNNDISLLSFNSPISNNNKCSNSSNDEYNNLFDNSLVSSWSTIKDDNCFSVSASADLIESFNSNVILEERVGLNSNDFNNTKNSNIDCIDVSNSLSRVRRHNNSNGNASDAVTSPSCASKDDADNDDNSIQSHNDNEDIIVIAPPSQELSITDIDISNSIHRVKTRQPLDVTPTSKKKHLSCDKSTSTLSTTSSSTFSSTSLLFSSNNNRIKDKSNSLHLCKYDNKLLCNQYDVITCFLSTQEFDNIITSTATSNHREIDNNVVMSSNKMNNQDEGESIIIDITSSLQRMRNTKPTTNNATTSTVITIPKIQQQQHFDYKNEEISQESYFSKEHDNNSNIEIDVTTLLNATKNEIEDNNNNDDKNNNGNKKSKKKFYLLNANNIAATTTISKKVKSKSNFIKHTMINYCRKNQKKINNFIIKKKCLLK